MRALRSPFSFVILSGYAVGALALYAGLPRLIPPSWTVSNDRTIWIGTVVVAFFLPTAAAVTHALLRGLCVKHPIDEAGSQDALRMYDAIMLRIAMFLMGVHAAVLLGLLGVLKGRAWAVEIVPVMLGLTMISIGNLLPRTRPNLAVGIRTRRMLSNRALWIRTHRAVGYMVVALGFVIVLSAIAVPPPVGPGMILAIGPVAIFATWFLVRYCNRQANGDR